MNTTQRFKDARKALADAQERASSLRHLETANACQQGIDSITDLEKEVERLEKLAKDLYVMAQHCPSNMIPSHFDFSTPLEQAQALEGKDG
ncbi:hypothetical protein A3709_19370 [Halioglobus sp. HI00S01]|uniref:hypothetical protein n=1 Tax=Halioglobus sp. HI00S01 TaxID=1822214 RepID=UPI0007C369CC|nr:hypothetical protein [Halioglobus sp. HI00S01]KZX57785.1 hypothetical protein A3709_19370 [Halioglobus sp. HI00S01]